MQIIQLTDKISSKKIDVVAQQIKLLEDADGGGTHIAFGGDMGRVVAETRQQIYGLLGITPLPIGP